MILSDRSIREALESGHLSVSPYDPALLQPSSLDVRLSSEFRVFHNTAPR